MTLAAFFETIAPYLEGRATHEVTVQALYGEAPPAEAERLRIYERFCRGHRNTATGGVHQALRALIERTEGEARWAELVEAYFRAHPMQHVEINENGAQLAAFLASQPTLPPMWSQLADFEWWEWQTFIAPDAESDAAGDAGPLRLASTVELRPYAFDFPAWLDAEPGARAPLPEAREVLVLFWRTRALDARRATCTPAELQVLKQVSEGLPVERDECFDDLHRAGILLGA